jgi:hypothetical protein
MNRGQMIASFVAARGRDGVIVRRIVCLGLMLCAVGNLAAAPSTSRILFTRDTIVPRSVQQFAWQVIETRCNYHAYERQQRSFWAYGAQARRIDMGVAYSISILSDLSWKKTDPPAIIEMTIVDDGRLQVKALSASFVVCAL